MEQELSNCPSTDRTFLLSTFPNTHSLWATLKPDCWKGKFDKVNAIIVSNYSTFLELSISPFINTSDNLADRPSLLMNYWTYIDNY